MALQGFLRLAAILSVLLTLTACQTLPHHRLHHRVLDSPQKYEESNLQLIALPLSIKVKEMSAGGIREEVGPWTQTAEGHIISSMRSGEPFAGKFELTPLGALLEDERAAVDEHVALFGVVAGSAVVHTMISPVETAWLPKAKRFDYTLGPGLAFLRETTGADYSLIVFGEDVISSEGRKAAFVAAALFGVAIPLGHSFLLAGIVELQTGDIIWLNYEFSPSSGTFRERADVDLMLKSLFADYPGIEVYKKALVKK
jgi:hypothetical protein